MASRPMTRHLPNHRQPVETEPADPPPAAITGDELQDVLVNFFGALAEPDFSRARTYCTDEFYEETIGGLEEYFSMLSEEEKAEMSADFEIDEEKQEDLNGAVSVYSGDSATFTITEEDGMETVFEFVKVDGDWKISGGME